MASAEMVAIAEVLGLLSRSPPPSPLRKRSLRFSLDSSDELEGAATDRSTETDACVASTCSSPGQFGVLPSQMNNASPAKKVCSSRREPDRAVPSFDLSAGLPQLAPLQAAVCAHPVLLTLPARATLEQVRKSTSVLSLGSMVPESVHAEKIEEPKKVDTKKDVVKSSDLIGKGVALFARMAHMGPVQALV